jgi:hypothetical protein
MLCRTLSANNGVRALFTEIPVKSVIPILLAVSEQTKRTENIDQLSGVREIVQQNMYTINKCTINDVSAVPVG